MNNDDDETPAVRPMLTARPQRLGLRVSGSRPGSLARPIGEIEPPRRQGAKDVFSGEVLGPANPGVESALQDLDLEDRASTVLPDRSDALAPWRFNSAGGNRMGLRASTRGLRSLGKPTDEVA